MCMSAVLVKLPSRMGLDLHKILIMIKSALPATICIAAFQSETWASHFGVLNYLVAIEALLAFCILPRAKFLQTLFLNVLMTCTAVAVNLFALWTAIQAREHTTNGQPPEETYNSSASAVCAVWFMVQIYFTNALRSSRPQFQFPCINYCIVTIISIVQAGPSFATMREAKAFMYLLLQAFFVGYGIAAGVSLFILPQSNREMAFSSTKKYFRELGRVLSAYQNVIKQSEQQSSTECAQSLNTLRENFAALKTVHVRLGTELEFAVRDLGFDRLTGQDLVDCYQHLRSIYLPLLGLLEMFGDLSTGISPQACSCGPDCAPSINFKQSWAEFCQISENLICSMADALDAVLVELQGRKPGGTIDLEKGGDFQFHMAQLARFRNSLASLDAFNIPKYQGQAQEQSYYCATCYRNVEKARTVQHKAQFMLWHSSNAISSFLAYVQDKNNSQEWQKKRIIFPSWSELTHWIGAMFAVPESSNIDQILDSSIDRVGRAALTTALRGQDPEHLPPNTLWQKFGERVRMIPALLRSPHSLCGFRATCASMSIGIIAYLRSSRNFFVEQRCLWAIVMTAIAMNNTTGQTTYNFILRVLASLAGTVGSFVMWYIVDGHPAGVIVFMFIYMTGSFYFCVFKPKYTLLAIVSAVTPIISVGYAMNVQKLSNQTLSQTNTPKFPIYQDAAYRLVNVLAGLAVAYFWSIFPLPVTEAAIMRQHMGACTYLLARYNAIISESLLIEKRALVPQLLAQKLQQARLDVLQQVNRHIVKLKASSAFSKWQVTIGGEFPVKAYREAIRLLDRISAELSVVGYTASTLSIEVSEQSCYLSSLDLLRGPSQRVTLALCILSASITNGVPLPPYFPLGFTDHHPERVFNAANDEDEVHKINVHLQALSIISTSMGRLHEDMLLYTQTIRTICGELNFSLL
ncbi:hypothetical protein V1508DRAFT_421947 [Lipomyces doorenjongii]|uniref:uncharacterized protein n=1 Tax=Lipomyces doorenjongii TaxID=383834 RepID=UPI0034CDD29E